MKVLEAPEPSGRMRMFLTVEAVLDVLRDCVAEEVLRKRIPVVRAAASTTISKKVVRFKVGVLKVIHS